MNYTDNELKEIIEKIQAKPFLYSENIKNDDFNKLILDAKPSLIRKMYMYMNDIQRKYFFKYVEQKLIFDDEESLFIERDSPIIALNSVKKYPILLLNFNADIITDEMVDIFEEANVSINKYLLYNYIDHGLNNERIILYFIKKDIDIINIISSHSITENIVNELISNNYDIKSIKNADKNPYILKYLVSDDSFILNSTRKEYITKDVITSAVLSNYCFEFIGDRRRIKLTSNESFSEDEETRFENNSFLLEYPELVESSYKNGYKDILFGEKIKIENSEIYQKILEECLASNIEITRFRNLELLNNPVVKNYITTKYFKTSNSIDNLNTLLEQFTVKEYKENALFNIKKLSIVASDDFVNVFGIRISKDIVKHILINNEKFNIDKIKCNYKELKELFEKIINERNKSNNLLLFQKLINYFSNNEELLNMCINNLDSITTTQINNLIFLIDTNINSEITNLESLNNLIYEHINLHENLSIKDKILLSICGKTEKDIAKDINTKYPNDILENIPNNEYKKIILLIKEIIELNDENKLDTIYQNISKTDIKRKSFFEIETYLKNYLFSIYQNGLTPIDKIDNHSIIDDVNIYQLDGEDFSFIVHVRNAFDTEYIPKYRNEFIDNDGKSYVSTSYINQDCIKLTGKETKYIFSTFNPENLISFSNCDIYSENKNDTSFEVTTKNALNWYLPNKLANETVKYNEFAFYRKNNDGDILKPSAILCYEDEELPIKEAKKNNIPIVIIDRTKYKNHDSGPKHI